MTDNEIIASDVTAEELEERYLEAQETNDTEVGASNNEAIPDTVPEKSIDDLNAEIADLKAQIAEFEAISSTQNRILSELSEFSELFPDTPVNSIPESVWEAVRQGAPLLASYALYEKRIKNERARIAAINGKNASASLGKAGVNTPGEYFTPDEVRKMSAAEVHANYSKIKASMQKWN